MNKPLKNVIVILGIMSILYSFYGITKLPSPIRRGVDIVG